MGKRTIGFQFPATSPYLSDIDGYEAVISGNLVAPPSLAGAATSVWQNIVAAAGGTLVKDLSFGFNLNADQICSEGNALKARKIALKFADGNSFSIPLRNPTNILTTAQAVVDVVKTNSSSPILCIALTGEKIDNANSILGVDEASEESITSAGSGGYYSGKVNYTTDSGIKRIISVKSQTTNKTVPPGIFATSWADCVGAFIDSRFACSSVGGFKHRRYTVKYRAKNNNNSVEPEDREIPIANIANLTNKRANILSCGEKLAAQAAVFCISYKGESDSRIDRQLNLTEDNP